MNALQKRVRKLERSICTYEDLDFVIHMIEPGTMRVASRLRLLPSGDSVKVDQDGNEIEARITALAATP